MRKTWPRVIGHRGAAASAPENTLESIRDAARQGVPWVEFDAKLTRDGIVILMHDDSLLRTTGQHGMVAETDYADIAMLEAGSWFGRQWHDIQIPTLAESLTECWTLNIRPNVEIKPCPGRDEDTAAAVVADVKRFWPDHSPRPVLSSFSIPSLITARRLAKDWPLVVLFEKLPADWHQIARRLQVEGIGLDAETLRQEDVNLIKETGYKVLAYTVNKPEQAAQLYGWGVDTVFSDTPKAILSIAKTHA